MIDPKLIKRLEQVKGGDSRSAFARRCGVSPTVVTEWFQGDRMPSVRSLKKIAERTNTPLDWLMEGDRPRDVEGLRVAYYARVHDILRAHLERLELDLRLIESRREALEADAKATKEAMAMLHSPEGLDQEQLHDLANHISNTRKQTERYARIVQRERERE